MAEIILTANKPTQLLDFLFEQLAQHSRTSIRETLKAGRVVVAGIGITAYNYQLNPGDQVKILPKQKLQQTKFYNKNLNILYEDNDIIIVNKREGLLSVGTNKDKENTAYHFINQHVRKQGRGKHIFVVHRLDRKTSGVMMFAKNIHARDTLRSNWNNIVVERSYFAIVEGKPPKQQDTIKSYLTEDKMLKVHSSWLNNGGEYAVTHYQLLNTNNKYSLIKLNLDTGRKNQIRVHMSLIGCPVAGDTKYDAKTDPIHRVCLHAATLSFYHPTTNKIMKFEVPIPATFNKIITSNN